MSGVLKLPKNFSASRNAGCYDMSGCFVVKKRGEYDWYNCREIFHGEWMECRRAGGFYYCTKSGKAVAAYVRRAERMLGLRGEDRCEVLRTSRKDIVRVEVGKFWRRSLRFSLLTLLLRVGHNYDVKKKDFWGPAKKSSYFSPREGALYAFQRFMKGYVVPNYRRLQVSPTRNFRLCRYSGWVDNFRNLSGGTIDQVLLRPKAKAKRDR